MKYITQKIAPFLLRLLEKQKVCITKSRLDHVTLKEFHNSFLASAMIIKLGTMINKGRSKVKTNFEAAASLVTFR